MRNGHFPRNDDLSAISLMISCIDGDVTAKRTINVQFTIVSLAPIYWCRWRWSTWPVVLCQWNWNIFYTHCCNLVRSVRLGRLACTWKIAKFRHCPMSVCAIHSTLCEIEIQFNILSFRVDVWQFLWSSFYHYIIECISYSAMSVLAKRNDRQQRKFIFVMVLGTCCLVVANLIRLGHFENGESIAC